MFLALWAALAFSQDCPDLSEQVVAARALFDDAELESAKSAIEKAYGTVGCQVRVVETEELLALYRLDGLVSLALGDPKGATYATIRAVAADHATGAPPAEYGPELAEEYRTWSSRLGSALIYVRVAGAGTVWIDGRELDASRWVQVAEGDHLVQVKTSTGFRSEVAVLGADHIVVTGEPGPNPVLLPEPAPAPTPSPVPVPVPVPIGPDPDPVPTGRRRPAAFFVTGILSGALGGAAIFWGSEQEKLFIGRQYDDDIYGGCLSTQDCYEGARVREIRGDADLINGIYATGYGLSALGAGLLTAGAVGLPPARPTTVTLAWRF